MYFFSKLLFLFSSQQTKLKKMVEPSILLEELAFAADSYFINDQLYVLFNRELLKAEHAVTELECCCAQQAERIRQKKEYI